MKITRRKLAGAVLAVPAAAQNAPAAPEELKAARDNLRRNAEAMAKVNVPVETEPAFLFRA